MTDAREYLMYFKKAEAIIELKVKQLQNLQDRLSCISAPLEKEQVSHTRNVAILADTIAMIVDMQKEIDRQTSEVVKRKREAYALMDRIKPESSSILIDHYFNGMSLMTISKSIHLTKRTVQRKLNDAIIEFQGIPNDSTEKLFRP